MARHATTLAVAAGLVASALAQPTEIFGAKSLGTSHSAGTGVTATADKLYITADDGSITTCDTAGTTCNKMTPTGATACNTVATVSPDGSEVLYAYETASGSTIASMSTATGDAHWSYSVMGTLAGAPQYGSDGKTVYFTWNDDDGHFVVLKISADGTTAEEAFSKCLCDIPTKAESNAKGVNTTLIDSSMGFSGVDVAFNPKRNTEIEDDAGEGTGNFELLDGGNYRFGEGNTNEIVVFAHLAIDDPTKASYDHSYYYIYQAPTDPLADHEVIPLDQSTWAVYRPPKLSSDGVRMLVAAQRGNVRGWTEPSLLSQGANIKVNIKQNQRVNAEPSWSAPSMTPDDTKGFVASTKNAVYGIDMTEETIKSDDPNYLPYMWEFITSSVVVSGTVATDDYVYAVSDNANFYKLAVSTGVNDWASGVNVPGKFVQSEFAVVGGKMYFVTTDGTLNGWVVEAVPSDPPTSSPTEMPTTDEPTATPTSSPTASPVTSTTTDEPADPAADTTTMAPETTTMAPETTTMAPETTAMDEEDTTTMMAETTTMAEETTAMETTTMAPETTTLAEETTTTSALRTTTTTTTTEEEEDPVVDVPGTLDDSSASKVSTGLAVVLGALALVAL